MKNLIQLYLDNAARQKQPINLVRNESEATIYVYDVIDPYWGVNAKDMIRAIESATGADTLHIRINSPGGDVFESRAIGEAIKRFGGKTIAHIDALAASAATHIALACTEVEIAEGGFFMIHNASALCWGDKQDMRDTAALLEKVEAGIVADYVNKTGKDAEQVTAWMDAETWFTAEEAIDNCFVDRLASTASKAKNTWNLAAFAKAPQALQVEKEPVIEPKPAPVEEEKPSMTVANRNRLRLLEVV